MISEAFKGEVLSISVLRDGKEVRQYPGKPNLILDRGLNVIADIAICEMFSTCVKGAGTTPTTEIVDNANSFSRSGTTVTRTAGTRDFTSTDIGKFLLFRGSGVAVNQGGYIASITSVTIVELETTGTTQTSKDITLYDVAQRKMATESGITLVGGGIVFSVDGPPFSNFILATGGNYFTAAMVGRGIYFSGLEIYNKIVAVTDGTHAQVDNPIDTLSGYTDAYIYTSHANSYDPDSRTNNYGGSPGDNSTLTAVAVRTFKRTFVFEPEQGNAEARAGNFGRSGSTVTRSGGGANFTSGDIGKVIYFQTDGVQTIITAYTNATTITVDTAGALTAQPIALYGQNVYNEFGFTNVTDFANDNLSDAGIGNNINARVVLGAPVSAYIATPILQGEQIKLVYQVTMTVSPSVATTSTLAGIIIDAGVAMSPKGKTGKVAIESYATAVVSPTGTTDDSANFLDPSNPGYLGISQSNQALDPLGGELRASGTQSAIFIANEYNPGDFARTYTATFGMTDAIGTAWRSLMLYDPDSTASVYCFLFDFPQTKSGDRILQMTLQKTWGRDFS